MKPELYNHHGYLWMELCSGPIPRKPKAKSGYVRQQAEAIRTKKKGFGRNLGLKRIVSTYEYPNN